MVTIRTVNELEELGKIISAMRDRKGWTQSDLASRADVSISYIQKLESGSSRNVPRPRDVFKVGKALDADIEQWNREYLIPARSFGKSDDRAQHFNLNRGNMAIFPEPVIIDLAVACGNWTETGDVPELCYDDPVDKERMHRGFFRIRLIGDSMEPEFKEGEVWDFEILRAFDAPELNLPYIFCRSDNTATFKYLHGMDDDSYILRAANRKKYKKDIIVPRQEICRVARVHHPVNLWKPKKLK